MHKGDPAPGQNPEYKDEWLTPPSILERLGSFDLDPCSPIARPWSTAAKHFTVEDDGLLQLWSGRVWLNPPYGKQTWKWLNKLALHGDGITLIFARTETEGFSRFVWGSASAVLFLKGRVKFFHVDGSEGRVAPAPSVLVAYGSDNSAALKNSGIAGKFIDPKPEGGD